MPILPCPQKQVTVAKWGIKRVAFSNTRKGAADRATRAAKDDLRTLAKQEAKRWKCKAPCKKVAKLYFGKPSVKVVPYKKVKGVYEGTARLTARLTITCEGPRPIG